jgi:hypothetical protein
VYFWRKICALIVFVDDSLVPPAPSQMTFSWTPKPSGVPSGVQHPNLKNYILNLKMGFFELDISAEKCISGVLAGSKLKLGPIRR